MASVHGLAPGVECNSTFRSASKRQVSLVQLVGGRLRLVERQQVESAAEPRERAAVRGEHRLHMRLSGLYVGRELHLECVQGLLDAGVVARGAAAGRIA